MAEKLSRIAVVGHFTYFENHFPEGWQGDSEVLCVDVDERDYSWLLSVYNFRPQLTLFFRPELYPRHYVESIPGVRVAILSEPLPVLTDGELTYTDETRLRERVYASMAWSAYHWRIFYDKGKQESAEKMRFPIDEFWPLPIDTSHFRPPSAGKKRSFDVTFLGKPTPHRISQLDFLRSSSMSFLWVAHGLSGKRLAEIFRRSKIVLNVHADGHEAFEPRLYLAAACGAGVVTERLSSRPDYFKDFIWEHTGHWNEGSLKEYVNRATEMSGLGKLLDDVEALSTRRLINDLWNRLGK
ncbi:hypothetical protein [Caballeronia sp. INSB1]|uniref:glycosyltransferase family protein n=1 Tax=Caballeronia sp. INSB1 TaxID=2921751 RepID=UPI002032D37F|nr:hypothetical protein [Caballeronia sp. INSB1]